MSGWTETISDPDMRLGEILNGLTIPVFSVGVGWKMTFFPESTFYDPAAVLDAMSDRFLIQVECDAGSPEGNKWWASIMGNNIDNDFDENAFFPDFTSTVRWLHAQAAAADPEFAAKWPVPE